MTKIIKRKKVSKACDTCRHSHTRCDGFKPCKRCITLNKNCQYLRISKQRGKPLKKENEIDEIDEIAHILLKLKYFI